MLLVLMLGLMLEPADVDPRASGSSLLFMCEKCERHMGSAVPIPTDDVVAVARCAEYIRGFVDATKAHYEMASTRICLPERFEYDQMVRVVVKFLRDHPEDLHHPRVALRYAALHAAFPCPEKTAPRK